MSYFARVAAQVVTLRDTDIGRVQSQIQQLERELPELNQRLAEAAEPDNADAIRKDLARWTESRDKAQAKLDELVAEIQRLTDEIPSDDAITAKEAEVKALRDPYMALYDQYQAERIKDTPDQTVLAQLKAQLDEQHPPLDAKQRELDTMNNTKNRNNGILAGKRRYRDGQRVSVNSYNRTVAKLEARLNQPSPRRDGIQAVIDSVNEQKAELNTKIDAIRKKYGAQAANIVVGRLFHTNARGAASGASNAAIFADGTRGGADMEQIEDAYMNSEDLIDRPPMELSIQGWPPSRARHFSERRATRRARQLIRGVGALLAGAPHWTVDQMLIHLNRYGHFSRYIASAGITEQILTREGDIIQNRVDGIIQAERARRESEEG